jgi:hypothetical protein
MVWTIGHQPLTAETMVRSRASCVTFVTDEVELSQVSFLVRRYHSTNATYSSSS